VKCSQCDAENRIDRLYCEQCGAVLEHDLGDVEEAVDKEIRAEKAKALARAVRWVLAASIVLAFAGYYFRAAYKELPGNDIVAFATAPTTQVNDRITVITDRFGVRLPVARRVSVRPPRPDRRTTVQERRRAAYRRAAVSVKHRGNKKPITGLLLGDLVIYVKRARQKQPTAVHIADIRQLRPSLHDEWEIHAVNLRAPVKTTIPNHRKVKIQILEPRAGSDLHIHEIPLTSIQLIKPAPEPKPR
jgi:hypothetical protein